MQGYIGAGINIGLTLDDEIIEVITLGNPRFNSEYQYELTRLVVKSNIEVIGGSERLFKYFIDKYKPTSIVSFCDISKFKGQVYTRLGFKPLEITQPSYVWWKIHSNETLSRYQTQKQKLIDKGYNKYGDTEDEIMHNLDYCKIYNCGNIKFIWKSEEKQ